MAAHKVYFSLGSNLGNREANIRTAIQNIDELIGAVVRQSTLLETKPWGFESEHLFVNAAACCRTMLPPHDVLEVAKKIERKMGRTEKTVNGEYQDRIIDIDILLYDDMRIDMPDLKIPHPLMEERDFVMVPLREIL